MTITGLLLIPLGLLGIFLPWRFCPAFLLTFAMMSPAAVFNAGSFGLQPGYFFALLVIARTVIEIALRRQSLNRFALTRMIPLGVLIISAMVALWTAMMFFEGKIYVIGGTEGFHLSLAQPYHFRRENMTQIAYLLLNLTLVYCLAHQGARMEFNALARAIDRAVISALVFASAVAMWQWAGFNLGVYFPDEFFYSNAGYQRADSQTMLDLLRINGCFEEPSTLGYMFTGFLLYCWRRYRRKPSAIAVGLIGLCLGIMMISTSTTAYFGIAVFAAWVGFDLLRGYAWPILPGGRVSSGHIAAILTVIMIVMAGTVLLARDWDTVNQILTTNVLDKRSSSSYDERSGVDKMALSIAVETDGIGLGLGSHKPNSLLMTLLSNAGVIGLGAFCLFAFATVRPIRDSDLGPGRTRLLRRSMATAARTAAAPIQSFAMGLLIIHSFSNPNLSFIALWIGLGSALGLLASLQAEVGSTSRAVTPSYGLVATS